MSQDGCERDISCNTCGDGTQCSQAEKKGHDQALIEKRMSEITYKFMVISGKGGVGKSSVAVNIGATLAQQGYVVGVLDADVHGPNIPKMLGVEDQKPLIADEGIMPIPISSRLRVMSIAFFLKEHGDAVIYRGPLKHSLLKQF